MSHHYQQTIKTTASLYQVMLLLLFVITILSAPVALSVQSPSQLISVESTNYQSSLKNKAIRISDVLVESEHQPVQTSPKVFKSTDKQTPFDLDTHTLLNRASAMSFQAEPQVMPDYALEVEFFPIGLLSASFAQLANPDKTVKWFEKQQSSKSSNRLSLWKDSNQLYTHRISVLS